MRYRGRPPIFLLGTLLCLPAIPTYSAPDSAAPTATASQWPLTAPPAKDDPYAGRVVFTTVAFTGIPFDGGVSATPVVKVRIGTTDATFIVDTGQVLTVISPSLAKRLKLIPEPLLPGHQRTVFGQTMSNASGQAIDMVTIPMAQMGDINFTPSQVEVFSDSTWRQAGLNVDGIIGLNFLDSWLVEFDFPRHQLTVLNPHAVTAELRRGTGYGPSSYTADITKDTSGSYDVNLELSNGTNRATAIATIDTGSYDTQITAKAAANLHLSPIGPSTLYGGFHRPQEVSPTHVSELQVGQLKLAGALIQYPEKDDPGGIGTVLGVNILSGYKVLMDFPGRKMYLQPSPSVVPVGPAVKPPTAKTP